IIENTKEERLYAGQNSGSYSIINLNNSRFNYSARTPPLEDALLMFKPGNTTEYVIDIDTNFFFLYDPNLSYEDIIGKYRVEFEWGIFKAEPKYFVVIK
ncbi:MAG: hypothetical protein KAJ51_10180, partial [Thermoplasmata archaeon]|nr:hypothetical protein [Thermoplasmata archaeon]